MPPKSIIPADQIEQSIYIIRERQVMLDADLAQLYGVERGELSRAVRRNLGRFPRDFMFRLNRREFEQLKEDADNKADWRGRRALPYAFTEEGIAMLACVLRTRRAMRVNVEMIQTLVKLRHSPASCGNLSVQMSELEAKYEAQFQAVFEALRVLSESEEAQELRILGFQRRIRAKEGK